MTVATTISDGADRAARIITVHDGSAARFIKRITYNDGSDRLVYSGRRWATDFVNGEAGAFPTRTRGYILSFIGSMVTPSELPSGAMYVKELWAGDTSNAGTYLLINGATAATDFSTITINGITKTSAEATFYPGTPYSSWLWAGDALGIFAAGAAGAQTLVIKY